MISEMRPEAATVVPLFRFTPNTIAIVDTAKGSRSVTNDIEAVPRKIEYWHQGSIRGWLDVCIRCEEEMEAHSVQLLGAIDGSPARTVRGTTKKPGTPLKTS